MRPAAWKKPCALLLLLPAFVAGCASDNRPENGPLGYLVGAAVTAPIWVPTAIVSSMTRRFSPPPARQTMINRVSDNDYGQLTRPYPRNEQPIYGDTPPNDAERKADETFIDSAVKLEGNRPAASDKSVSLGFGYLLTQHDPATAMKRFNQAWLLDPDNGAAFHGMALTLLIRDNDAKRADPLFARGIAAKRQLPGSFMDYGRFLLQQKRPAEAVPILLEGRERFPRPEQGIVEMEALLATAYAESGQMTQACQIAARRLTEIKPPLADRLREIVANPACHGRS